MARAKASAAHSATKKRLAIDAQRYQQQGSRFNALICKLMAERTWPRGPVSDMLTTLPDCRAGVDTAGRRFAGALHALVLERKAPELATLYPSNDPDHPYRLPGAAKLWPLVSDAIANHKLSLMSRLQLPVIDNDPAQCAALIAPVIALGEHFAMPIALDEINAGAGLNLILDHYHYQSSQHSLGNPDSPVMIPLNGSGRSTAPESTSPSSITIAARAGCDLHPVNLTANGDQIRLLSHVAPEDHERMARLRAAIRLAVQHGPIPVSCAPLTWLDQRLTQRKDKQLHVLIDITRKPSDETNAAKTDIAALLNDAGALATASSPLAWLQLEPDTRQARSRVVLTVWPGGKRSSLGYANLTENQVQYKPWRP